MNQTLLTALVAFIEALINLFKVKSIMTIILVAVFARLSTTGIINADQFIDIFKIVIIFYFGTQYQKAKDSKESGQNEIQG